MRKISLDVDALKVESFDTEKPGTEERGTVRAHYDRSYPNWDCPFTWGNYGCRSVSGEVVCECAPNTTDDVTCDALCL
jgi:hypothetical protein